MVINDVIFNCDLDDILQELRIQLHTNRIPLLEKEPKRSGNSLQIQCPYHGNGQEKNRSAGIRKSDGMFHCFACGEIHTLPEFITFTFGYTDDVLGKYGWKWLLKNFATISVEERDEIVLDFNRTASTTVDTRNYISEEELDRYRYYHSYWDKRGITDKDLIELFDLGFDEKTNCITFPVKDINGNCLFVARRSVKYKYFNYPEGTEKPLYGLWELYQLEQFPQEIIVCESMLDALTCWQYGSYAVALNGTGDPQQFKALKDLPCRELIVATDNDNAGNKAFERIRQSVTNKLVYRYEIPRIKRDNGKFTKDINDLTEEEFKSLQKHL